jgi:hypothetical protein
MPLYSIKGPDGREYQIEGPEGASKEQIVDAIQYKLQAKQDDIARHQNKSAMADLGTKFKQGLERLPGAVAGLADIPFAVATGHPVIEPLATKAGELTGFQPSKWADQAEQYLSPEYQAGQQEISKTWADKNKSGLDVAKAYLANPRQIAGTISEALPMTGAIALTGGAAGAGLGVESLAARAALAGAGEGAFTAGSIYDQAIQGGAAPEDARRKALAATGAGLVTGAIGAAGSKLSTRLGIVDPESIFNKPAVQALSEAEINTFMNAANRGIGARLGVGAVKEGLLEELPQSVQEQMWQNYAENKPIMQDVARSAVEGALAGSAMGGGANLISKSMSADEVKAEVDRRTKEKADEIQKLQDRMATEAMGGTRESRPLDAALAAQGVEDKMGRENVRTELARPIYQTKEEVTAVLEKLREVYPELDQTQLNQTRLELQRIRENLPTQADAAKALVDTKPIVAPVAEPTTKPAPVVNPLVIDDALLDQWGVKGRDVRKALKEYSDLSNPEHVQQVFNILHDYPRSNVQRLAAQQGLLHLANLQQGAPNVTTTQEPTSGGVQDSGARPAPVGQGSLPGMELPSEQPQPTPQEVAEPGRGGVDVPSGVSDGNVGPTGESAVAEPSALAEPQAPQSTEVIQPEEAVPVEVKPAPRNLVKDIKRYQAALQEVDPEIAKDVDDLLSEYNEAKKGGRKGGAAAPQLATAEHSLQTWMDWADKTYPELNMPSLLEKNRPTKSHTSVEKLNEALGRLFTPNLLAVKPPHVFATHDEIPEPLRSAVSGAMAFVTPHNQQEHYIADKIPRGEEIATILHEKGGHLGMAKLVGRERINRLANQIIAWSTSKATSLENKIARDAISRAAGDRKHGENHWKEEIVAYYADLAVHKYKIDPLKGQPKEFAKVAAWLRDLWNGVLSTIRKLHYNPESLTAHDIVSMVYGAARMEMHEDYQGRPNVPGAEAPVITPDEMTDISAKVGIPGFNKKKKTKRVSDQERQDAQNAGRQVYEEPEPPTVAERIKNTLGDNMLGWLAVKLVGGGESLALKGTKMFGPEARLNPVTGKELGYLNYHRALHDNDLATGAAQYGYLELDKEGVFHVKDSPENVVALNDIANKIKAQMVADGMTEAAADDAFAHMMLTDRFKELQKQGVVSTLEFSKADHAYGQQMKDKYRAGYDEWQKMYQTIRGRTIKSLVDSGTFSPKKAKEFLDRLEYIPFNREQGADVSDAVFLRSLLSAKGEHHIKGSERQVKDVMANIVDNQVWLMKRAVRNNASNLVADTMTEMHKRNPLMGGYETTKEDKSPNVISYLKNGELQYYKVLDPNDAAIFASAPAVGNTAIRIMRMFTGYLRRGVTLMPSFHYGQIIQDAMRAPAVAGTKAGMAQLMKTSVPEFWHNIAGETPLARSLRRAGIVGQIDYQDTYDNWRKEVLGAKRKGMGNILERAERIAQANDLSTRAAVYNDILKQTGNENEASLRALMMINFQNRGHSQVMNTLMAAVPFVNSRIQGEYRLLMALSGKIPGVTKQQAKQLIAWRIAKMAAFTAIYAMASGGDNDYETAGEDVKNHNFLFNGVKVPVAPEFLPLKVGIEKAYRLATDQQFETGAKAARAELAAVAGLFLGAGDLTPTMIKPLLENTTNYSFFSGHNLVGFNQLGKDTNLQFNEGTSEFSKGLSNMLQSIGGNTLNISPIKMDNLIRGWFGTMGKDFLYTVDMMTGDKPMTSFNQLPLAGGMFYNMQGGALKSDFYDLKDQADKVHNTLNDYKKSDPAKAMEYYRENQPLLAIHSRLESISNYLDHARKEKAYVTKTYPDTAGDRVNEINARVNEMLKNNLPPIMTYLSDQDAS